MISSFSVSHLFLNWAPYCLHFFQQDLRMSTPILIHHLLRHNLTFVLLHVYTAYCGNYRRLQIKRNYIKNDFFLRLFYYFSIYMHDIIIWIQSTLRGVIDILCNQVRFFPGKKVFNYILDKPHRTEFIALNCQSIVGVSFQ